MGGHYVYVVQCTDGTFYTGYTTNVRRRIKEHNNGDGAKYTRGRNPVSLVHTEEFETQSKAMQREYEIKQLSKSAKQKLAEGEKDNRG